MDHIWRGNVIDLLEIHRNAGDLIILVSGGPEPLLLRIACELGIDHVVGTPFETRDGRYTGKPAGPACVGRQKPVSVREYLEGNQFDVDLRESFAYADSASDIHLLKMVRHPVVVYPFDDLRLEAKERGWEIFPNGKD